MPYKSVVAVGDSFTRGDELADCPENNPKNYSNSTWPALLAQSMDTDYRALATGGIGNQCISFKVNAYIRPNILFIINWTWFERFDYVDIDTGGWKTTHPRHENKLDHYFYKNIDSDIWNLHKNLQQIHSTIQMLRQHNINFIMTCLDPTYTTRISDIRPEENSFYNPRQWGAAIDRLHEQVVPHILDFEGQTFLEWSHSNNFKCGPGGHPLEDAHAAAADYLLKNKLHL